MEAAKIFSLANQIVLLGWLLLIILPNWKYTKSIILNGLVVVFTIVYAYLILKDIGSFKMDSFSTLANVKALFQNDEAVAAGWVHYLAFDLVIGTLIVSKAREIGIARLVYTLVLPFTFMFGPIGYLTFFIVKTIKTKSLHD